MILLDSRGAGAIDTFDIYRLFYAQIKIVRMSEEVPCYGVANAQNKNCIDRAVRSCHWESTPTITDYKPSDEKLKHFMSCGQKMNISEKIATEQYEVHSPFIFEAIVDTFEKERKQYMITIESIHKLSKKVRHL